MIRYDDPLELFRTAVDALATRDWATVIAACDPVSLRAFKRGMLDRYSPAQSRRGLTVDDYLRHSPDMPREVAEYNLAQQEKQVGVHDQFRSEFPNVADVATLATLEPTEVFAEWLDGRSPQSTVERLVATGVLPEATAEKLRPHADLWFRWIPLGVIPDGDRMAHLLYRDDQDSSQPESPEWRALLAGLTPDEQQLARDMARCGPFTAHMQLCRRQPDGSWRLVADDQFLRLGAMFFGIEDSDDES